MYYSNTHKDNTNWIRKESPLCHHIFFSGRTIYSEEHLSLDLLGARIPSAAANSISARVLTF